MKEDNGRDSPAEYSEPVDGGTEVVLKLRLSSSFADTKLAVYSKDTIGQCKKKLQVSGNSMIKKNWLDQLTLGLRYGLNFTSNGFFSLSNRHKRMSMHVVNDGFIVVNCLAIKFWSKMHKFSPNTSYRSL